jgi:AraC family transcriptional regulator
MILTKFPNLNWLKAQAEEGFAGRRTWSGERLPVKGWPNVILNVTSGNMVRDNIRGPLSIFTNLKGESHVEVDDRRIVVKESTYFLTNHDQYYTLAIDKGQKAETFNIHFGEYFVDQVYSSLNKDGDLLMEDEFRRPPEHIEFHNRLAYRDDAMQAILVEIKNRPSPNALWLEEKLYDLVRHLLTVEKKVRQMETNIPSVKASTRSEILRRLLLVTDYIYGHMDADLALETLAGIACLSKFHFLRLFKLAFQKTPYQFITEARIKEARRLLMKTKSEVQEIGRAVGFENTPSFSRMFFNHLGVYPTDLRRKS